MLRYMTLIIPEGYAQFVIVQTTANTDSGGAVFTFGVGEALGPDPVPLEDAAALVAARVEQHLVPITDTAVIYDRVDVFNSEEGYTEAMQISGEAAINQPPPNTTLLVRKTTSRRGPRAKGRMYPFGMLDEGSINEQGNINEVDLAGIQEAWTDFYEDVTGQLGAPVVILQNEEGISPPLSPPPVVDGFLVDAKVASQRRRLRR